jgi:hypothetical protein
MKRPLDFPKKVRVALIAGNLASRGITFQNPALDFTCTSFCFTDTKDAISRGASNTQRFGRACGILGDVFAREGRQPILIATKGIVDAAVANEASVMAKAKSIPNGTLLSLKDLITEEEWKKIMNSAVAKEKDNQEKEDDEGKIDGVDIAKLKRWINRDSNLVVAKMVRFLYECNKSVTFDGFKEGIMYSGTSEKFKSVVCNGSSLNSKYGHLWNYKSGQVQMNLNIKNFIKRM